MKMMKLFGLAAAAVCLLALAGCGGQSGGEAGYTKEQVQTILDSGAFTDELDELDCDTAWALYQLEEAGLSREDLTDGVIYRSAGATCEELSLLIFSDSGAAQTAQGALEAYLQSQIENNRDYRPGEIPAGSFCRYPGGGGSAGIREFWPAGGCPPAGFLPFSGKCKGTIPCLCFPCGPGLTAVSVLCH